MSGLVEANPCLLEVAHGPARFAVLVGAGTALKVGPGVQGVSQVGPGGEDGLSDVGCPYPAGGLVSGVRLGGEQGDMPRPLF